VDASPAPELRAVLETVGVDVLGEKDSGALIGLVTDVTTGKTDGTITPGEDIVVTGDKLKVAPEDDNTLGVFFVNAAGAETRVTRNSRKTSPNASCSASPPCPQAHTPSRLLCAMPIQLEKI
jgi:hypothetical protein